MAAYQAECPVPLTFGANARTRKNEIVVWVHVSIPASVHVFGRVGWKTPPKARGDAMRRKAKRWMIVGLDGGIERVVELTRFTVPLPIAVRRRLRTLNREKLLMAELTVRATDGATSVERKLTVKLPGRGR
jgi:hypothetical protein